MTLTHDDYVRLHSGMAKAKNENLKLYAVYCEMLDFFFNHDLFIGYIKDKGIDLSDDWWARNVITNILTGSTRQKRKNVYKWKCEKSIEDNTVVWKKDFLLSDDPYYKRLNMSYSLGQYFDQDTGRTRYAAFCSVTHTWQFSSKYGKVAAEKLVAKLNKALK